VICEFDLELRLEIVISSRVFQQEYLRNSTL
jgi:hypothetical protein